MRSLEARLCDPRSARFNLVTSQAATAHSSSCSFPSTLSRREPSRLTPLDQLPTFRSSASPDPSVGPSGCRRATLYRISSASLDTLIYAYALSPLSKRVSSSSCRWYQPGSTFRQQSRPSRRRAYPPRAPRLDHIRRRCGCSRRAESIDRFSYRCDALSGCPRSKHRP
ncbi:cytochrome P450 [Pseudozyma hubeiensis SY62]|uniref:Cytochrome P450 n=1 Tax=Pseudozyma hubeiensis (strain SY62) TaxID=1305764 RepID=R9P540_PSEHS|nr:cytochrome P450 [Pseudozyma hubeiensis SY62]GAC96322.1 cytochrome P450 [Pseudozyma hubeiensis SY62]